MKKQSIVLGSMFVVGLLLLVPNVSAVEFKALSDTDLMEDELRESI